MHFVWSVSPGCDGTAKSKEEGFFLVCRCGSFGDWEEVEVISEWYHRGGDIFLNFLI